MEYLVLNSGEHHKSSGLAFSLFFLLAGNSAKPSVLLRNVLFAPRYSLSNPTPLLDPRRGVSAPDLVLVYIMYSDVSYLPALLS